MKDKNKFKVAAILAMIMLFLIYFPTAVVGYFTLGNRGKPTLISRFHAGFEIRIAFRIGVLLEYHQKCISTLKISLYTRGMCRRQCHYEHEQWHSQNCGRMYHSSSFGSCTANYNQSSQPILRRASTYPSRY